MKKSEGTQPGLSEPGKESKKWNTRRDFLKKASIAGAGIMVVPRYVLGGKGYIAPSDRLVIAGIGVGGKGRSDLSSFYATGKAEIGYLCDVDRQRSAQTVETYPNAKFYEDWREMFDKEAQHIDAVSVSTPDHNHAVQAMAAMQLGKHVFVQKPLTHDVYEARVLTDAASKYKVVTQMGNQGASGEGVRLLHEWYDAGLIGDVHTVQIWTNRPIWQQGIPWPKESPVPDHLNWDLWLGTAPWRHYVEGVAPSSWRGWWDYGTGALGDLGCHLLEAPFRVLNLKYPLDAQASVSQVYTGWGERGYFPDTPPPASHATLTFPKTDKTEGNVTIQWMDGGITPPRPPELEEGEQFGDGNSGILFIGTKGKMLADEYARNPRLLPTSRMSEAAAVPQKFARVEGDSQGHYGQWVEACLAGYGNMEVSSPFELAGPLTEACLMANLAIRVADMPKPRPDGRGNYYPAKSSELKLLWDHENMRVTNYDDANQFVKREYRQGWSLGV
ncbi:MAG TPA: Gfo/Idh/MocA family oxidoreductase [Balneolaceae bacterium]|nr:Gfo/Idh/MocA family oxidoreductase [Balneolaceae bacterium]